MRGERTLVALSFMCKQQQQMQIQMQQQMQQQAKKSKSKSAKAKAKAASTKVTVDQSLSMDEETVFATSFEQRSVVQILGSVAAVAGVKQAVGAFAECMRADKGYQEISGDAASEKDTKKPATEGTKKEEKKTTGAPAAAAPERRDSLKENGTDAGNNGASAATTKSKSQTPSGKEIFAQMAASTTINLDTSTLLGAGITGFGGGGGSTAGAGAASGRGASGLDLGGLGLGGGNGGFNFQQEFGGGF